MQGRGVSACSSARVLNFFYIQSLHVFSARVLLIFYITVGRASLACTCSLACSRGDSALQTTVVLLECCGTSFSDLYYNLHAGVGWLLCELSASTDQR
jgi:hypothetical protein